MYWYPAASSTALSPFRERVKKSFLSHRKYRLTKKILNYKLTRHEEVLGYIRRLQAQALSPQFSLKQRMSFLSIVEGQVNELMQRVLRSGEEPSDVMANSSETLKQIYQGQQTAYTEIVTELKKAGIEIINQLDESHQEHIPELVERLRCRIGRVTKLAEDESDVNPYATRMNLTKEFCRIPFQPIKNLQENPSFYDGKICAFVKYIDTKGSQRFAVVSLPKTCLREVKENGKTKLVTRPFPRHIKLKKAEKGEAKIYVTVEVALQVALKADAEKHGIKQIIGFYPWSTVQSISAKIDKSDLLSVIRREQIERGTVSSRAVISRGHSRQDAKWLQKINQIIQEQNQQIVAKRGAGNLTDREKEIMAKNNEITERNNLVDQSQLEDRPEQGENAKKRKETLRKRKETLQGTEFAQEQTIQLLHEIITPINPEHSIVKLEIGGNPPDDELNQLQAALDIDSTNTIRLVNLPVNLYALPDLPKASKSGRGFEVTSKAGSTKNTKNAESMFDLIAQRGSERIVRHPKDAFEDTVLKFIRDASNDAAVTSIKIVIYRSGVGRGNPKDNPVIKSLIKAKESGKDVTVFLEVRARGDGLENSSLKNFLEKQGIKVITHEATEGRKVHAKMTLVTRTEPREDGVEQNVSYSHIGTGNYNPVTSKFYIDTSMITADPEIAKDLQTLFGYIEGEDTSKQAPKPTFEKLLVAPFDLSSKITELIKAEQDKGTDGYIALKMNELSDPDIINALQEAAKAGCKINLIVRGVSMLLPTTHDNGGCIKILSKVDKFLEHDRIYQFGKGEDALFYLGSADMHIRKINGLRVEILAPVSGKMSREQLQRLLDDYLSDEDIWVKTYDPKTSRIDWENVHLKTALGLGLTAAQSTEASLASS
jgi:hypothetical protein